MRTVIQRPTDLAVRDSVKVYLVDISVFDSPVRYFFFDSVLRPPSRGDSFTMATETTTIPPPSQHKLSKNAKLAPENERYMRACSDIANALIQEYESQKDFSKPKRDINLNKLRSQVSKKHHLSTQPSLTAIIAAVPEHYKKYILPKLIAKPIRM